MGRTAQQAAERIADEGGAPKLQPTVGWPFVTDPVRGCYINAIGQGMRALDELPGLVLPDAELSLFARMPADSCGIEENLSPLESGQAGRFRIPLIPADQNADPA